MDASSNILNLVNNSDYITRNSMTLYTAKAGYYATGIYGGTSPWSSGEIAPTKTYYTAGTSLGSVSTYQGRYIIAYK